ncbi:hypothetical protein ACWOB3_07735 [Enterococcus songbeiensis]
MKDFNEAVLTIDVNIDVADVYKKAIETENSPKGLDHWNGNYAFVTTSEDVSVGQVKLTIQLLSHTLPNLKQVVDWYERVGCTLIRTGYKGGSR